MSSIDGFRLDEFRAEFEVTEPMAYIYGLHDPRDGELRYIGKSIRPRQRLQNQLNEHPNTHRGHWLDELTRAGLTPIQTIIDAVPADTDWQTVECVYIAGAREAGHRLVNGTDGGDGVAGLSDESKARIRAAHVGRKASPETRARLSAARRGRRVHTERWRAAMAAMRGREVTWSAQISTSLNKLTDDQVRAIREELAAGESQYRIAERFGIHQGSVSNIARGATYREVQ